MQIIQIGRDTNNDVIVQDAFVGRKHLLLKIEGDKVAVKDLDSKNGTYVNGMRINGEVPLHPGDVLKIGKTVLPWPQYVSALPVAEGKKKKKDMKEFWTWVGIIGSIASVIGLVISLMML